MEDEAGKVELEEFDPYADDTTQEQRDMMTKCPTCGYFRWWGAPMIFRPYCNNKCYERRPKT